MSIPKTNNHLPWANFDKRLSSTNTLGGKHYRYQSVSKSCYRQYYQILYESIRLSGVHPVLVRRCRVRINLGTYRVRSF